jgi:hypothetical protein
MILEKDSIVLFSRPLKNIKTLLKACLWTDNQILKIYLSVSDKWFSNMTHNTISKMMLPVKNECDNQNYM